MTHVKLDLPTMQPILSRLTLQPKKKEEKKWMKGEPDPDDVPLDDPLAEKMRQQRSVEAHRGHKYGINTC